ncbi:MAG: hypothetical protein AB7Q69_10150 [Gemmatimonadales bacterium]
MRRGILVLGLLLTVPGVVVAQDAALTRAASTARQLWARQDAQGLAGLGGRILVQLPGADPSAPVSRQQAAALLRGFFQRTDEVETTVAGAKEVANGLAYVELRRRYRTRGTQETREQTVLLSFRRAGAGWVLVELRVGGER